MNVVAGKAKRGRPKGSKNKVKKSTEKSTGSACDVNSDYIERLKNKNVDSAVLSKMETFRNCILEKLKEEFFGNDVSNNIGSPSFSDVNKIIPKINFLKENLTEHFNLQTGKTVHDKKTLKSVAKKSSEVIKLTVKNKNPDLSDEVLKKSDQSPTKECLKDENNHLNKNTVYCVSSFENKHYVSDGLNILVDKNTINNVHCNKIVSANVYKHNIKSKPQNNLIGLNDDGSVGLATTIVSLASLVTSTIDVPIRSHHPSVLTKKCNNSATQIASSSSVFSSSSLKDTLKSPISSTCNVTTEAKHVIMLTTSSKSSTYTPAKTSPSETSGVDMLCKMSVDTNVKNKVIFNNISDNSSINTYQLDNIKNTKNNENITAVDVITKTDDKICSIESQNPDVVKYFDTTRLNCNDQENTTSQNCSSIKIFECVSNSFDQLHLSETASCSTPKPIKPDDETLLARIFCKSYPKLKSIKHHLNVPINHKKVPQDIERLSSNKHLLSSSYSTFCKRRYYKKKRSALMALDQSVLSSTENIKESNLGSDPVQKDQVDVLLNKNVVTDVADGWLSNKALTYCHSVSNTAIKQRTEVSCLDVALARCTNDYIPMKLAHHEHHFGQLAFRSLESISQVDHKNPPVINKTVVGLDASVQCQCSDIIELVGKRSVSIDVEIQTDDVINLRLSTDHKTCQTEDAFLHRKDAGTQTVSVDEYVFSGRGLAENVNNKELPLNYKTCICNDNVVINRSPHDHFSSEVPSHLQNSSQEENQNEVRSTTMSVMNSEMFVQSNLANESFNCPSPLNPFKIVPDTFAHSETTSSNLPSSFLDTTFLNNLLILPTPTLEKQVMPSILHFEENNEADCHNQLEFDCAENFSNDLTNECGHNNKVFSLHNPINTSKTVTADNATVNIIDQYMSNCHSQNKPIEVSIPLSHITSICSNLEKKAQTFEIPTTPCKKNFYYDKKLNMMEQKIPSFNHNKYNDFDKTNVANNDDFRGCNESGTSDVNIASHKALISSTILNDDPTTKSNKLSKVSSLSTLVLPDNEDVDVMNNDTNGLQIRDVSLTGANCENAVSLDNGFINVSDKQDFFTSTEENDDASLNSGEVCKYTYQLNYGSTIGNKKKRMNDDMGYSQKKKRRLSRRKENEEKESEYLGNDDVDLKNTVDRVLVNHFTETAGNINNNPSLTSDATTANNFNVKSPVYKKLKRCTYMDAKPVCKDKCNSCDCRILQPMNPLEKCCGEDCLNRQSFDECTPSTCSTGDKCTNRPMQKRLWKINSLSKFLTENMGYGVRTTEKLTSGQFIIEYCGEVVSEDEFRRRMTENYSKELHHYCLNLGGGFVIDGYRTGNISRFINHSCQPNCDMQKWNVNGIYRIGLFALTDISEGAELTYDYNFHSYNILSQQVCRCGAPNCRGVMGGKSQKLNKFIVGGIRNEISNGSYGKKGVKKKRAGYLKKPSLKVFPTSFLFSSGSVESIINKILPSDDKLIVQRNRLLLVRNLYKCIPKKLKRNAKNCTSSKYLNCKNDYNNHGHCWKSRNHKLNDHYGKFLSSLPGFEDMFNLKEKLKNRKESKNALLSNCFQSSMESSDEQTAIDGDLKGLRRICINVLHTISDANDDEMNCSNHQLLKLLHMPEKLVLHKLEQEPTSLMSLASNVHMNYYDSFQSFNLHVNHLFRYLRSQASCNVDVEDAIVRLSAVHRNACKDALLLLDDQPSSHHLEQQIKPSNSVVGGSRRNIPDYNGNRSLRNINNCNVLHNGGNIDYDYDDGLKSDSNNNYNNTNEMLVPHQLNDGFSNINTEVFNHDENKSSILMNGCTESKNEHEEGNGDNETDVIRCVCNIYNDEGVMIQCEKCETWQHCMCMGVKGDEEEYMCELCQPRQISQEILLVPQPDHGLPLCRYYITLLRDDRLQVRVGDCVYVSQESSTDNTADEEKILDKRDFGIFRVERLWRKYNGDGCASGYYYVRPHETFHEANRKFFPNEVFRTPRYHVIPIEDVVGTCCVMDLNTYCKGRPLSVTSSEDLYICDYRVDETARLFYKISKTKHPINTNSYCFHHYTTKLKPKRTYMPHQMNKP